MKKSVFLLIILLSVLLIISGCKNQNINDQNTEIKGTTENISNDTTVIKENEYFKVIDVGTLSDRKYVYYIYNKEHNLIFEEETKTIPKLSFVEKDILQVSIPFGTSAVNFQYFNIVTETRSENFNNVVLVEKNKLFYMSYNKNRIMLIVQDIFDKKEYYKVVDRDFSEYSLLSFCIKKIKFIDTNTIKITYLKGKEKKKISEIINL